DGPHGVRKQAAAADHLGLNKSIPATCFPTAATMANSWNDELGEEMGLALGEEARAQRVNMLLGPGTNMKRNPRCGRNFEYFSEDPYLAGKMAASYIRGIQKNGISACVKHFAANNQEERRMSSESVIDERTLREIYLTAFEIAVKEGKTKSLMSSYNLINGEYANENEHLLREILRKEWGYNGIVVSDWAGSNDRVAAVKAGSDIEMPSCLYGIDDVIKAVNDGALDISYVDECVERILELNESTLIPEDAPTEFDYQAHNDLARRCAEDSIVLLKNDGTLPLKNNAKVALIGDFAENPRYQGAGSSIVNPTILSRFVDKLTGSNVKEKPRNKDYEQGVGSVGRTPIEVVESVVEDMNQYNLDVVGYEKGFNRYGKKNKKLIDKAVELAKKAEVVLLFLGLDEVSEAEGLDRENVLINENQIELYKALKKTDKKIVVILSCGSSVELSFADDCAALVYACLSGQACSDAVLNVLTGKVNPSGKLAESFPVKYDDCPTANYFPGKEMTVEYREGPYIGYRYYDKAGVKVQYPFGYGLSYTTFEYGDLIVKGDEVTFTVKNVGDRDGAEISELYIGKKDSAIFRPAKELKGFKKTFIKAGESATVTIKFDDKSFRYFNVKTNGWEEEGGEYEIYICASIDDIRLEGTINRMGTTDVLPYDLEKLPSYVSGEIKCVSDEEFEELLGRTPPPRGYNFYKKNRMVIDENCTISDLRYSRRWVGRAFSGGIRLLIWFCKAFGMKTNANTLVMGMLHQPVRGLAKFTGLSRRQMEAMLMMFNGKFWKGFGRFVSKEKKPENEVIAEDNKKEESAED
ncbi:MAG: glycoside hydrolase family 3 C-terminal domain-containing protein, partial [Clostridia bacterium]|nr:glycoside hydrolase family 3 C-terminal domain-containing protein [Clostridia bacterium]